MYTIFNFSYNRLFQNVLFFGFNYSIVFNDFDVSCRYQNLNFVIFLALNRFLSRNTYTKTFLAARVIHIPSANSVLTCTKCIYFYLFHMNHTCAHRRPTQRICSAVNVISYLYLYFSNYSGVVIGDLYCTCVCRLAAPAQVALEA